MRRVGKSSGSCRGKQRRHRESETRQQVKLKEAEDVLYACPKRTSTGLSKEMYLSYNTITPQSTQDMQHVRPIVRTGET